jgi:predicted enzyme related to lactoylglutathione lyase
MGERTEHAPGTVSWTDLGTTDADGAKAFYTVLFGWEPQDNPIPGGGVYTMMHRGGLEVAAVYQQQQEGTPPNWLSYVTVTSADDAAARAKELGATLISEPFDIMDVGRMAVIADPQGAVFAIWEPGRHIGARLVNDPGAMSMTQLVATDRDTAMRFYEGLFGWRFEQVSEQPPFFSVFNGDRLNAGLMDHPGGADAQPYWLVYFTVEDLDRAVAQIGDLGGRVEMGPMEIPAGRIAVAQDPQGAWFGLFEGEVDP